MSKIFLYIDESKYFEKGVLIFGGFCSENNKPYLENWIEKIKVKRNISQNKEMKSSEKFTGKYYLEEGFLPKEQNQIKGVFGLLVSEKYTEDSYLGYLNGLKVLIGSLNENKFLDGYSEIVIYIDNIKLLSDQKILEKSLKKELTSVEKRITQVTLVSSKASNALQLADLITGIYKDSIRNIRHPDFDKAFHKIKRY